ncbi:MAG: hypothetical protein HQK93_03415 [Nitrospirae bacterium]|nr:hypothetical protein [Nitrospirota bacterium]
MRNEKKIILSIGEVTIYEIQAKHIRKLVRGDFKFDFSNITNITDVINSGNINKILDFADPLVPELSSMTKEQFEELTLTDIIDVVKAFIETNIAFFLEKTRAIMAEIEEMKRKNLTAGSVV